MQAELEDDIAGSVAEYGVREEVGVHHDIFCFWGHALSQAAEHVAEVYHFGKLFLQLHAEVWGFPCRRPARAVRLDGGDGHDVLNASMSASDLLWTRSWCLTEPRTPSYEYVERVQRAGQHVNEPFLLGTGLERQVLFLLAP